MSGKETADNKLSLTEDHFSRDTEEEKTEELISTSAQMESTIAKHINILRNITDENVKKKLVKKIIELRIKLNQLNDINEQLYVCGHKLMPMNETKSGSQLVCDQCLKRSKAKIFGLKKSDNYLVVCLFCQFVVHRFCQTNLMRKCPKLVFEESALNYKQIYSSRNVILKICPEVGLSNQEFRCAECKAVITYRNNSVVIPARIIHNWDFTPKAVSRSSLQIINYIKLKPVLFNITELNSMLYGLVDELAQIKGCRGKGFFCELCRDKEDLLFPFSPNIANCVKCSAVYHK
ncbi:unnamed protein product [Oppiella nova]|uniref:Phorbol-ester/DAG-type domain-containing protein n=1 Tax=Oppiella nova TaxID=334625 RepID=A0A7R9QQR9_9ACAR|nr:unnamed protein product [Oppiella nova]CAG2172155.1 unnamed protein product [Oppiella nova]